jgi:hypothetical protein
MQLSFKLIGLCRGSIEKNYLPVFVVVFALEIEGVFLNLCIPSKMIICYDKTCLVQMCYHKMISFSMHDF